MSIKTTRGCVDAIIDGSIENTTWETDPLFGWELPASVPGVDEAVLKPRNTWPNPEDYDAAEKKLVEMYVSNFEKYRGRWSVDYSVFGPKV